MNKPFQLCTYRDTTIVVHECGSFSATLDGSNVEYDTLAGLKVKIDKFFAAKSRVAKKKFSVACINSEKKKTTVTGLHARTGAVLMKPAIEDRVYGGPSGLFLDCPRAIALLDERTSLNNRIEKIDAELERLEIKSENDGYGAIRDESACERLVAKFEKRIAAAKAHAERTAP